MSKKPNSWTEAIEIAKEVSTRGQTEPILTAMAGAYYRFGGFTSNTQLRKELIELMDKLGIE